MSFNTVRGQIIFLLLQEIFNRTKPKSVSDTIFARVKDTEIAHLFFLKKNYP